MVNKYSSLESKGIVYCDTQDKAINEISRLFETGHTFGVDTETKTLDPYTGKLRLVQIADTKGRIGVFDTWKIGDLGKESLRNFLACPGFTKIFHHAKFDTKFIKKWLGVKELYPMVCTMLEASLLACGNTTMSKSLEAVLERYLSITINKSLQTSDWGQEELSVNQILYSAIDARDLIQLHNVMYSFIKKHGMEKTFRIEMNCIQATAEMELNGMPLNYEKWCARADADEAESKEEEWKVFEYFNEISKQPTLFGEPEVFNINSHIQLKDKFRKLGIKIPVVEERDGRRRETTGKDQLKEIVHVHPVIQHIINYRILHKAYTTYGRNWSVCINPVTKRVHANFNQNGSETGRYTTGEEVSDHMDPPMLGIPRADKFRNCFEAPDGRILVWGDYSQAELRILADFSGDQNLLQCFIDGRDPHMDAATRLFGLSAEEITSEMRHLAKDLGYAIPYGVNYPKFALKAHITEDRSKELMNKYFKEYPRVKSWLEAAGWRAINQRNCRTASGRLLRFNFDDADKRQVSATRRNGKNSPIQGTCSDIIKTSLVLVYKETRGTNILLCHVFHDEIILECDEDQEEEVKELLERNMVKGAKVFLKNVPVKVDVKSGKQWGK
jgi:DNA polymerase I-like protein with 3'-5' exonuclease and polymerase domains